MSKQLSKPILDKLEQLLSNVGDMSLKRRARKIIEEINPQVSEKIIDLGCGTGYYLYLLSNLPVKLNLTGFDNDSRAIAEAKLTLVNKKVSFIVGDIQNMPFKNNSFEKAVSSEVLEHLTYDTLALKEIFRILKPGGVLVISVPSINYPFLWDPINWILQRIFKTHIKSGFLSGIWNGHIRLYNLKDLQTKVTKAGFKVEIIKELTFWCIPFNHYLINAIARLLYDVKISPRIANNISKFKESKKPLLFASIFKFINWIDKLNEVSPHNNGVNIFIKAIKTS